MREFTRLQWKRTLQNIIPPYSITFYFYYTYLPLLSSCLYFILFFYWTNFISIIIILNLKNKKIKKRKWNMHMYCVLCSMFICLFSHKRLRFEMELRYCTCQGHWRLWFLHEWRYYIVKLHIQQKQNLVTCKCISNIGYKSRHEKRLTRCVKRQNNKLEKAHQHPFHNIPSWVNQHIHCHYGKKLKTPRLLWKIIRPTHTKSAPPILILTLPG